MALGAIVNKLYEMAVLKSISKIIRDVMVKERNIEEQMQRGIEFIAQRQFPSGEIPTVKANNKGMENASYVKTVAITFLVIWALKQLKNYAKVSSIIQKGVDFLLAEKKENEIGWRFFGKDSDIIPDLDDTASILTVLKENNIHLDYENYARELIKIRNEEGLFYTWFPEKGEANNVDWVVNANVLYFFQTLGIKVPEVERFLIEVAQKGFFKKGSLYYHSPYAFCYFVSKLYTEAGLKSIEKIKKYIVNFILDSYKQSSCIELALGSVSLLNLEFSGKELETMIENLRNMQRDDGGWPVGTIFKHRTKEIYYGSRELSTSFSIEALRKFSMGYILCKR